MSSPLGSEPTLDDEPQPTSGGGVAGTALGPTDIRDTPHVKPSFETREDDVAAEDDPWIGRTLSNVYVVESRIGEGGMGAVYLARHVHLQKAFAVKVLVDAIAGKSNAVERLRQEAMAAASIDHENIVDVVNFDRTDDGAVYIVMELLRGESLASCIGRGPVELHRALPITYQICRALHAAHENDIVHRDLKPENVFLTEKSGRTLVKVLDFGISKIKTADAEQVRMTRTGQLVGTPLYMSPEQARGEGDVDRRVDVYAMGVILYEMITGAPPFEGRNYFELLWKHGNEPPPPMKARNPNVFVPEAVEAVVARALSKERDARFSSMAELEQALLAAAPEVPSLPPSPSLPPERAPSREPVRKAASKPGPTTPSAEVTLPTRKPWLLVVLGLAAAIAIANVSFTLLSDDADPKPEEVSDARSTAREPEPAPEPEPPAPAAGVDAPTLVPVQLASHPEGAEVRIGDRVLGTTPLTTSLEVADEPLRLTFSKPGYLDQILSVIPAEDVTVPEVRLRRRPRPTRAADGPDLPIKTSM